MAGLRFTELQSRPLEFLDFTSVTLDEFQQLVPPFGEQGDAGGNRESPVEWPVLFTCHSNPEKPPYACQTATRHLSR